MTTWGNYAVGDFGRQFRIGYVFTKTAETDSTISVKRSIRFYGSYGVDDTTNRLDVNTTWTYDGSVDVDANYNTEIVIQEKTVTFSKDYGSTQVKSFSAALNGLNVYGTGTTATVSGSYTIPARDYDVPTAPDTPTVARTSDTSHTVTWNRNASVAGRYQNQYVMRQTLGADGVWSAFSTIKTITTDYTTTGSQSYTDNTTAANNVYRYKIKAANDSGEATSGISDIVYTTPVAPTSVVAAKNASGDIVLTVAVGHKFTAANAIIEESQDGGAYAPLATVAIDRDDFTYTHVSPSAAVTHTYRVSIEVDSTGNVGDGLTSATTESNTVVLASAPNPPVLQATVPVVSDFTNEATLTFVWDHYPTDTTPQRKRQIRYRVAGDSWFDTSIVTTSDEHVAATVASIAANTGAVNGDILEWAVSTWGEATTGGRDGTGASEWSATGSVVLSTTPTVAITSPVDASTLVTSELTVDFTYFQAESSPQAQYRAVLKQGATVLETKTGAGEATSVTFATPILDGESYTVEVDAQSEDGKWSDVITSDFDVSYLPPALVEATAVYYEDSGTVLISLFPQGSEDGVTEEAVSVTVERSINGGDWEVVATDIPADSALVDTQPSIHGINCYRLITVTTTGSTRVQESQTIATNYFTDPSFETTGADVEVRRNAATNPMARVNLTSWYAEAYVTMTRMDDGDGPTGETWVHFDRGGSSAANYVMGGSGTGTGIAAIAPSTDYTVGMFVRPNIEIDMAIAFNERNGGASQVQETIGDTVTCPAGVWTFLSITKNTRSDTAYGGPRAVLVDAHDWGSSGLEVGVAGLLVEASNRQQAYCDGSYSPDPDLSPSWVGTADASESILEGALVSEGTGTLCSGISSIRWSHSGGTSMRLLHSVAGEAYQEFDITSDVIEGGEYTISAIQRQNRIFDAGSPATTKDRNIVIMVTGGGGIERILEESTVPPDTVGEHEQSITFTVPTDPGADPVTAVTIRLYGVSPTRFADAEGESVWWDSVTFTDGAYTGTYIGPGMDTYEIVVERSCGDDAVFDGALVDNGDGTWSLRHPCFLPVVTDEHITSFLSTGPAFDQIIATMCEVRLTKSASRDKTLRQFENYDYPHMFSGNSINKSVTVSGTLSGTGSTTEELEDIAQSETLVLWRDTTGNHIYGSIGAVSQGNLAQFVRKGWNFGFTVTRTQRDV